MWCGVVRGTVGGVGGPSGEGSDGTWSLAAYLCHSCVTLFRRPLRMWHTFVFLFLYPTGGVYKPFIIILGLYNFVLKKKFIVLFNTDFCKGDTECHYLITVLS